MPSDSVRAYRRASSVLGGHAEEMQRTRVLSGCVRCEKRCERMRQLTLGRMMCWTVAEQLPDNVIAIIAGEFDTAIRLCLHEDLRQYHSALQLNELSRSLRVLGVMYGGVVGGRLGFAHPLGPGRP